MVEESRTINDEAVKAAARSDFEIVQQISFDPALSLAAKEAKANAELTRLRIKHMEGMTPDQIEQFTQIYAAEFNRVAREAAEHLKNNMHQRQRQTIGEMATRTAVRATIWETVYALFRAFR